jgi:CRISPR type IV-associated protein Csf3
MHFRVTLHPDAAGLYYDPGEPIHLDALLAWALAPMQSPQRCLDRNERPFDVRLPLLRSNINGSDVWHASALFPDGVAHETLRHWRKRFRQARIENTSGSPNLQNGIYREYNMPVPLLLAPRMIAYASGNRKSVKKLLRRHITALGKKRAYGYGRVTSIECEETPEDWSLVKDGRNMRWLPSPHGTRLVRPAPPYWNSVDRVMCAEVEMPNVKDEARL